MVIHRLIAGCAAFVRRRAGQAAAREVIVIGVARFITSAYFFVAAGRIVQSAHALAGDTNVAGAVDAVVTHRLIRHGRVRVAVAVLALRVARGREALIAGVGTIDHRAGALAVRAHIRGRAGVAVIAHAQDSYIDTAFDDVTTVFGADIFVIAIDGRTTTYTSGA